MQLTLFYHADKQRTCTNQSPDDATFLWFPVKTTLSLVGSVALFLKSLWERHYRPNEFVIKRNFKGTLLHLTVVSKVIVEMPNI